MNNKLVQLMSALLGLQLLVTPALATTTGGSGYNAPILRSAFNFTATLQNDGSVATAWVPYAPTGFNYYKVVRSTTNPNPVYPDDGYILASGDPNLSSYVDNDPPSGTVYYRVCSIASPNRYCSSVVTLAIGDGSGSEPLTSSALTPASMVLKGSAGSGYALLSWVVEGSAPYGFKVCKSSVNQEPTYPIIPGDAYQYLTDPNVRQLKDTTVKAGVTYYYRVCQYDGQGTCVAYSNSVAIPMAVDGANATADKTVTVSAELAPATISLIGAVGDGFLKLSWALTGSAPNGFKIAKSTTHESPTYPVMEGDDYIYLSDPAIRVYKDTAVESGKTYHYRVCQYDGSGCVSYSNAVSLAVPGGWVTEEKVVSAAPVVSLEDVEGHPYSGAIEYMLNKNIVQGYTDGTFRPDAPVNRAEFLKMLLLAKLGQSGVGDEMRCFRDVTTGWYAPYVCFAKTKGIVSGYPDGTFKPSRTISFAEAAKMVAELYALNAPTGGTWYEGYIKALEDQNAIPPSIASPAVQLTRGEVAELVWRVKEGVTSKPSADVVGAVESVSQGAVPGWQTFEKNGYSFSYPTGWYRGLKSYGWDILSEEKDYIDNLNTPNYMAVDTYVATYVAGSGSSESALASKVWFGHPLVSSERLTVNGFPALKRHYRAPAGTVVNGRTTGENENIYVYTYLKNGKVIVVQYFNAYGDESYGVDQFEKIAMSFR